MINYHELARYGFWGIITVLVNFLSYVLLIKIGVSYIIANVISIIVSKTFAYISNKYFVFKNAENKISLKEIVKFIFARGTSGLVDFFGLIILVSYIKMDEIYGKVIIVIITTIINYILGKYFVFKSKGDIK